MKNKRITRVESEAQYDPRPVGEILHNYFENSNEPLAVAYRKQIHSTTEFGVDLKLMTRETGRLKPGRDYQGVLRRDVYCEEFRFDEHFTFVETLPVTAVKRNPHVFVGEFLTITRRDDGTLRPNLKQIKDWENFNVEKYAIGVSNELLWGLSGLVEK